MHFKRGRWSSTWQLSMAPRKKSKAVCRYTCLGFFLGVFLDSHWAILQRVTIDSFSVGKCNDHFVEGARKRNMDYERPSPRHSRSTEFSERQDMASVCSIFRLDSGTGTASTTSVWNMFLDRILVASRLPEDDDYSQRNLTRDLLNYVSPRLPNSVRTLVRNALGLLNRL